MVRAIRGDQVEGGGIRYGLLVRYRVMAVTTAVLLIVLVFVGVPLQLWAGRPEVVNVVGTMHGFLYLVYLCVAFQLTRKLRVPKWQMALVLLAGTVPFCAFVAERKMTRRFEVVAEAAGPAASGARRSRSAKGAEAKRRWLSRRALLLHLEVAVVAPGCAAAGWWQATRALAGNELSWAYSIEWPVFALLAIAGWWHLIHEDPEAYRARRARRPRAGEAVSVDGGTAGAVTTLAPGEATTLPRVVDASTARFSRTLAALVGVEIALGIAAMISLPIVRPSGWVPAGGAAIYLAHAVVGLLLAVAAAAFLVHVRQSTRVTQIVAWMGCAGIAIAGVGGLLTVDQSLVRFFGIALMFVGPVIAGLVYLIPALDRSPREPSPVPRGLTSPTESQP